MYQRILHSILLFLLTFQYVLSGDCDLNSFVQNGTTEIIDSEVLKTRPCDYILEYGGRGARFTTYELAARYGFTIERHHVTTEDGYILELHRIAGNSGKPAVFLIHAYFQSSRDFFLNCNRRALAVRLADEGFDVWLANTRGNFYSEKHVNFTRDDPRFWDFGIDELALYDTQANVDYILDTTKQNKINWVGFSSGNAQMMGFLSSKPEYNSKMNVGFVMGAAAVVTHIRSPLIRLLYPFGDFMERYVTRTYHGELFPRVLSSFFRKVAPRVCLPEVFLRKSGICSRSVSLIDGYDPNQIDPRVITTMYAGFLSSISVRSFTQWFQWIKNGQFAYYDFGTLRNLQKYNTEAPPIYPLGKITSPIVHFWGLNDFLAVPVDVLLSKDYMPDVVQVQVNSSSWNHVDMIFGKDADVYIYDQIVNVLKECKNTL